MPLSPLRKLRMLLEDRARIHREYQAVCAANTLPRGRPPNKAELREMPWLTKAWKGPSARKSRAKHKNAMDNINPTDVAEDDFELSLSQQRFREDRKAISRRQRIKRKAAKDRDKALIINDAALAAHAVVLMRHGLHNVPMQALCEMRAAALKTLGMIGFAPSVADTGKVKYQGTRTLQQRRQDRRRRRSEAQEAVRQADRAVAQYVITHFDRSR